MIPSRKEQRLDRQLRMWGKSGQELLETASVGVLGSSALAAESLKNLVLPGIGEFTVIDDAVVSERDLGNNFFVTRQDLGKPRAEAIARHLAIHNPYVKCRYRNQSIKDTILKRDPVLESFTLVIASNIPDTLVRPLANHLNSLNIPLVVVRVNGLLGYLRIFSRELCIIDSKPEGAVPDLRVNRPFPELEEFADSYELDELEDEAHAHVPFVVIQLKAIKAFQVEVGEDRLPETDSEKKRFKKIITGFQRPGTVEGNISEAYEKASLAYRRYRIPYAVREIIDSSRQQGPGGSYIRTGKFWTMARALGEFVKKNGVLPVPGDIPDMVADTVSYIRLKKVYSDKAKRDALEVFEAAAKERKDVTLPEVEFFCKNSRNLVVLEYSSFDEEEKNARNYLDTLVEQENDGGVAGYYIYLKAAERFYADNGYYPGERDGFRGSDYKEEDIPGLRRAVEDLVREIGGDPQDLVSDKIVGGIVRFGGSEIHTVCSFVGGICAQEVLKIVMRQYVPVHSTMIFSAVEMKTEILEI